MEVESSKIYVDVELFKGDYCAQLSPDLLQQKDIYPQTDDESSSNCSVHSADTVLQSSQQTVDPDGSLTGDDKSNRIKDFSPDINSSEEDDPELSEKLLTSEEYSFPSRKYSPVLVEHIPNQIDDLPGPSVEKNSPSLITEYPSTSKNTSTLEKRSGKPIPYKEKLWYEARCNTPIKLYGFPSDSSSEEVIPPSPICSLIKSNSTASVSLLEEKSKKYRRIIELGTDSSNQSSDNEPLDKQQTAQRLTKKDHSSIAARKRLRKPKPKGEKKIVMNQVVYPSAYPTSSEESSSDDLPIIKSKRKPKPLSKKLLEGQRIQKNQSDVISLSDDDS